MRRIINSHPATAIASPHNSASTTTRKITWDAQNEEIQSDSEASTMLTWPYRSCGTKNSRRFFGVWRTANAAAQANSIIPCSNVNSGTFSL
jgi:hypothetical protein